MPPIAQDVLPQHPQFQLNASGLAGFFGGDEAIAAMNTIQYYKGRKSMGFYNSPGGFRMAKHYGRLAKSRIWRGLYPDACLEPAEVFSLNGSPGEVYPDYFGAKNGVMVKHTGHLTYLFLRKMRHEASFTLFESTRKTRPAKVTIVKLGAISLPEGHVHYPAPLRHAVLLFNVCTILASLAAAIISGLYKDWYAFSLILLGIIVNGAACFVLGSGRIKVNFITPPQSSLPGDGLMTMGDDLMPVIVLGEENAIFQITRGSISVEFPAWVKWNDYFVIGACSLLLMFQFLVQLFLIPQATLFGQILFLCSFGVSFLFNTYLSAIDKGDLQRETLGNKAWNVGKDAVKGYEFQNWTTTAIAIFYILEPSKDEVLAKHLLDRLLPNQSPEWNTFKTKFLETYRNAGPKARNAPSDEQSKVVQNMYKDWNDADKFFNEVYEARYDYGTISHLGPPNPHNRHNGTAGAEGTGGISASAPTPPGTNTKPPSFIHVPTLPPEDGGFNMK